MTLSPESRNVANAFHKYIKTNDKTIIEGFSIDEIRRAMLEFHLDRNAGFYKAMELRANDLEVEERLRRTSKEKWKDRIITFLLGLISGIILLYIGYKFFPE